MFVFWYMNLRRPYIEFRSCKFNIARSLDSVVISSVDQKVLDSIPSSAVGFFSTGDLFHYVYRMGVFCFFIVLSQISAFCCLQKRPQTQLTIGKGRPSNCVMFL